MLDQTTDTVLMANALFILTREPVGGRKKIHYDIVYDFCEITLFFHLSIAIARLYCKSADSRDHIILHRNTQYFI